MLKIQNNSAVAVCSYCAYVIVASFAFIGNDQGRSCILVKHKDYILHVVFY